MLNFNCNTMPEFDPQTMPEFDPQWHAHLFDGFTCNSPTLQNHGEMDHFSPNLIDHNFPDIQEWLDELEDPIAPPPVDGFDNFTDIPTPQDLPVDGFASNLPTSPMLLQDSCVDDEFASTLLDLFDFTCTDQEPVDSCVFDGPTEPGLVHTSGFMCNNPTLQNHGEIDFSPNLFDHNFPDIQEWVDGPIEPLVHTSGSDKINIHSCGNTIYPLPQAPLINVPETSSEFIDEAAFIKAPQPFPAFRQFEATDASNRGRGRKRERSRWTDEEHRLFLLGVSVYGDGHWKSISRDILTTKSHIQIASHAQKYYQRRNSDESSKKRKSIHDTTLDDIHNPYLSKAL